MRIEDLGREVAAWLDGSGPEAGIVLSSRVRLARNLAGYRFPHRASDEERERVFDGIAAARGETDALAEASVWDLRSLDTRDRQILVERHLGSQQLADGAGCRGVAVGPREHLGLMINEEDHLRIQSVASGLNLEDALERAVAVDRELESRLDYATSPDRGYLTTCPTNVGTGLRASILIHLPALVLAGEVKKVHRAVGEMGMAVRGWFGEGSGALGDYYQVSNQRTLGSTEREAVSELAAVARRVLELESEAREKLRQAEPRRRRIEDRVHRSYGTLRTARFLSVEQVMSCASDLRLGKSFGYLQEVPSVLLNRLAVFSQPAHLMRSCGRELEGDDLAWERAAWIRREFDELGPAFGEGAG